jgi:tryptophan synthase alpha chain
VAIGEAYADAAPTSSSSACPFSDPLADGPVIHAAGTQALAGRGDRSTRLGRRARLSARMPVVVMCYANLVVVRGPGASRRARGGRAPAG